MSRDVNMPLSVDDIDIPDGRRALNHAAVSKLISSIEEVGLRHPITVRRKGERYLLVAGRHRLEAFRKLDRDHIPAIISTFNNLEAELWEIDENLCRSDLTPSQEAAAVARRKQIYEELHPEARHGGDRRSSRHAGDLKPESFVEATADATGKSERSIQRAAARGEAIERDVLDKIVGTSLDRGEELDALALLSPERRNEIVNRAVAGDRVSAKTAAKQERRDARERALGAKQRALPQKKYGAIIADPEWRFEPRSRETGMDRAADNHYSTSETADIAARDIASIAADDCVLFLWGTAPMLKDALQVMEAWGFEYKTHIVWHKTRNGAGRGTGYWFTGEHELLLVGTRGHVVAPATAICSSLIAAPWQGRHSAKPDCFAELIEEQFPTLPKIELNRRGKARPGWDAWGFEVEDENEEAA